MAATGFPQYEDVYAATVNADMQQWGPLPNVFAPAPITGTDIEVRTADLVIEDFQAGHRDPLTWQSITQISNGTFKEMPLSVDNPIEFTEAAPEPLPNWQHIGAQQEIPAAPQAPHLAVNPQFEHQDLTYVRAPHQNDVATNEYIGGPPYQHFGQFINAPETPQSLPPTNFAMAAPSIFPVTITAPETPQSMPPPNYTMASPSISPVTANYLPVPTETLPHANNPMAPPRVPLPTPPVSDLETSAGEEPIPVAPVPADPAKPYRPTAPKRKAGRPPGSKTKKARFENGQQLFSFEHTTVAKKEFKPQGKVLKTKAHDAKTGELVRGEPIRYLQLGKPQETTQ